MGGEFDLICGKGKGKIGAQIGPLQGGADTDGTPSAGAGGLPIETKIEGKVGLKLCLPPPPR